MSYFPCNPLNAELNLICHLLALLGAHHIRYVSRIRVKKSSMKYKGYTPPSVEGYELRIKVLKRGVLVYVKALSKRVIRTSEGVSETVSGACACACT